MVKYFRLGITEKMQRTAIKKAIDGAYENYGTYVTSSTMI